MASQRGSETAQSFEKVPCVDVAIGEMVRGSEFFCKVCFSEPSGSTFVAYEDPNEPDRDSALLWARKEAAKWWAISRDESRVIIEDFTESFVGVRREFVPMRGATREKSGLVRIRVRETMRGRGDYYGEVALPGCESISGCTYNASYAIKTGKGFLDKAEVWDWVHRNGQFLRSFCCQDIRVVCKDETGDAKANPEFDF